MYQLAGKLLAESSSKWPASFSLLKAELTRRDEWNTWEAADPDSRVELLTDMLYRLPQLAADAADATGYPEFLQQLLDKIVKVRSQDQTIRRGLNEMIHAQLVGREDLQLPAALEEAIQ